MNRLAATTPLLAAIALLCAPASAHHSQSMFDTSKEIVIEGTVARFDWVNPHMYIVVETTGPGRQAGARRRRRRRHHAGAGRRARSRRAEARHAGRHARQSESRRLGQAGARHGRHDARRRDSSVLCGEHADARADAGREPRGSLGAVARGVRRRDRRHGALAGHAGGPRRSGDGSPTMASAIRIPPPVLSVFDELRTIELGEDEVVMQFDNTGDRVERIVHMTAAASGQRSTLAPRTLHRPVGRRDARDRYDRLRARLVRPRSERAGGRAQAHGRAADAHGGPHAPALRGHRRRPDVLTAPATLTQQWDHRPDLEFSQNTGACDPEVARRYKDHVPQ